MSREAFATLIAEFEERDLPRPTPRAVPLAGLPGKADALVGMRGIGKTWRMDQHMGERLDRGVARKRLLYVNLEDERLNVQTSELSQLMDAWYARRPDVATQEHWLYLDEVQVQGLDAPVRRRVLQEYVDVAVLRDVIERHQVTQVRALRWLVRRLLANPAGRFSANRFHRDLKSQGLAIGKDTVHELLSHVEEAHLVHTVSLWTASAARRQSNPRKAYPVDPALSRTAAFAKPDDVGHRLENLVYLELRRRGFVELGYLDTSQGFEVDFCGRDAKGNLRLVQVCARLSDPPTRHRELRALDAGMTELGVDHATLVTLYDEETVRRASGTVRVVPAWHWLLEAEPPSP